LLTQGGIVAIKRPEETLKMVTYKVPGGATRVLPVPQGKKRFRPSKGVGCLVAKTTARRGSQLGPRSAMSPCPREDAPPPLVHASRPAEPRAHPRRSS